jgi:hypothetical protein
MEFNPHNADSQQGFRLPARGTEGTYLSVKPRSN